jgi:hypothetical protein
MKKYFDTILANDSKGRGITIRQIKDWLRESDEEKLADFFWYRYYGRYLKPFDYESKKYKKHYKNGFAIMTSCCLLIETFVSFTEPKFKKTKNKSERCFGYFFMTNPKFNDFAKDGLSIEEYLDDSEELKKVGRPHDFYANVRCGILHNGETRNRWKIIRDANFLFDLNSNTKTINAFRFMNELKVVIDNFRKDLIASDFDKDTIWKTYKDRLQDLIDNS